ncbi:nuclease-related domain-containing protein [Nocardioides sp. GCM10027113]|uniref:nuclease-related domain-containing protein n=1 Tax=unclassified Nocardioides TaxID=2615069 RepID=UPI003623D99D
MAGESARESARRQRAKAERLQRSVELYQRHAEGEARTARALEALPGGAWTVLHDLGWPGRKHPNVDHIAVGPPGVFVVDTKNWPGDITVRDGVLRQGGRARATAVAAVRDAAAEVAALVPSLARDAVHPVLCFVSDGPLSGRAGEVLVCSTSNVVATLATRPVVMSDAEARRTASELERALDAVASRLAPAPEGAPARERAARGGGREPALYRVALFVLVVVLLALIVRNLGELGDLASSLVTRLGG